MIAGGRTDLLRAAAESIAATRPGTDIAALLSDGDRDYNLSDAALFAIDGVLKSLYPEEAGRIDGVSHAFDDFWELQAAITDAAFAVGIAYGHLVAKAEQP